MSITNDSQRLLAKRQHRILGMYLAVGTWSNNLDAVVLERASFIRFLSLERVKKARIQQFKEDIKDWFPFVDDFYRDGDTLHSVYLSRVNMSAYLPKERMNTEKRVEQARERGLAIAEWRNVSKDIPLIKEEEIVSFTALLGAGLSSPRRGNFAVTAQERMSRLHKRAKLINNQKSGA